MIVTIVSTRPKPRWCCASHSPTAPGISFFRFAIFT
jgi:hypothetical protein